MSHQYHGYTESAAFLTPDREREIADSIAYFRKSFAPLLPAAKNSRILEIGCGYGKNLLALREAGYQNLLGIDISPDQVAYAREHLDLPMVEQADLFDFLGSVTELFDAILIIDVLEHLTTDELCTLAGLLNQSLHPGGVVVVQVPNALAPLNPIPAGDLTHQRAFTTQSLRQLFLMAGLVKVAFFKPKRTGTVLAKAIRSLLLDPAMEFLLKLVFRILHGKMPTKILFSANIIGIAYKSDRHNK